MTRPASIAPRDARLGRARGVLLVLLFLATIPAVTTRLYSSDEIEYFAYLRSVWFDRDLSFENEYRYFYDRGIARGHGFEETFLKLTTPTGKRPNFATIGSALLWAPFYGVADLGVRAARVFGSSIQADGFSTPYLAAVTYGSAFYGFLALLLSAHVARRIVGPIGFSTLAVALGTPLTFYMYVAPGMSHACSAFAVAAFIAVWLHVRERWSTGGLGALGVLAAVMTMVREQDAFFVIGPAIDLAWTTIRDVRAGHAEAVGERAKGVLAGTVLFAVAFLPQALAYIALNGRIGPDAAISSKMQWTSPHALQVLLSTEHGFFFWTPLALLTTAGLVMLSRSSGTIPGSSSSQRQVGVCLLVMFATQVYIAGSIDSWSVAGAFGQRRFVAATVLLVAGLGAILHFTNGWQRKLVAAATVIAVWWNIGLAFQFGAGLMDRQRLQLALNAYNTFIVVPISGPALVYRYLFDRSSFYQSSAQ